MSFASPFLYHHTTGYILFISSYNWIYKIFKFQIHVSQMSVMQVWISFGKRIRLESYLYKAICHTIRRHHPYPHHNKTQLKNRRCLRNRFPGIG